MEKISSIENPFALLQNFFKGTIFFSSRKISDFKTKKNQKKLFLFSLNKYICTRNQLNPIKEKMNLIKKSVAIFSSLLITLTFFACGEKDKGVQLNDFKIEKNRVVLIHQSPIAEKVKIISGNGDYAVLVENSEIASAVIKNNELEISPLAVGNTQVSVTDKPSNKKQQIEVIVTENISVSEDNITLGISEEKEITITGSGSYEVEGSTNLITTSIENGTLRITGKQAGNLELKVVDKITQRKATISVKVSNTKVVLSTYTAEVKVGGEPVYIEIIPATDNAANYQISKENDPTDIYANAYVEPHNGNLSVKITPLVKHGNIKIFVTKENDENGKATIDVVIKPADFTLAVTQKEGFIGGAVDVDIFQGSGEFSVTSADPKIATGQATEVTEVNQQKKKVIRVLGISEGSTNLTITDTQTQQTATLSVNILPPYILTSDGKLQSWKTEAISENIVIPASVTELIDNTPFNRMKDREKSKIVTFVAEGLTSIPTTTFMGFENLTSVTLGANIAEIGRFAFARTGKLQTFIIKATTPPTLGQNPWALSNKTKTLIVPTGAKQKYIEAGWNTHFTTIEERQF